MEKENLKEKEIKQEKHVESTEESTKNETNKIETQENNDKSFKQIKKETRKVKKAKKQMEEKKRKPYIKIAIILMVILILALTFSTIFALINMGKDTIVNGVKIEGIDVSNLTAEEAKSKLEQIYNQKLEKEISIKYQEYENAINPKILETKYKIEEAVKNATNIGRNSNIFKNNYEIINAMLGKTNINIELEMNEEIAKKTIEDIGANLPGVVVETSYFIENGQLIITKGQEGVKIDTDNLLQKVKEQLIKPELVEEYIDIPVITAKPTEIDIEKIHSEIYKEVQDAYYTQNPFTIHPEVEGIDFDIEQAKKILEEDKDQYTINLIITKPKVTTDQIGTEAFPDQLATFKTTYDGGNTDRTTNLRLACEKINGKVLLAGETFSYNKTLGPRTASAGYKNAAIYSGGEVVDGIGGGICQISSTLYNAVLRANLEIVERRNHQFVTSYVEAGMDATVVYGTTDFKFKNTRKYPIKIVASAKNGVATVSIYGIKEEEEYTFSFRTVTVSTIPTTTKYVEDPTLEAGKEKVKQKGANGKVTETYMTKMLNGKIISTTLLSKDTYSAMQKIVLRGTKGAKTTTKETNTKTKEKKEETTKNTTTKNETKKEETKDTEKKDS